MIKYISKLGEFTTFSLCILSIANSNEEEKKSTVKSQNGNSWKYYLHDQIIIILRPGGSQTEGSQNPKQFEF